MEPASLSVQLLHARELLSCEMVSALSAEADPLWSPSPLRRGLASTCKDLELRLNHAEAAAKLESWAQRIALYFGADWVRLDVYTGAHSSVHRPASWRESWVVNEISYPGGTFTSGHISCVNGWHALCKRYEAWSRLQLVPAQSVLRKVAAVIGNNATAISQVLSAMPAKALRSPLSGTPTHIAHAPRQPRGFTPLP